MIEFDAAMMLAPDAGSAQMMASIIASTQGAPSDILAIAGGSSSDGAVLQDSSQKSGDEWIALLLSSASCDSIAAGTAAPGEVDLLDRQSVGDEEEDIIVTGRRYTGRSYTWDGGGGDGSYDGGGSEGGGSGGSFYAAPVAQHTQDCGTPEGAAVQVAKHVKGTLPEGVSGPEDPLKTSTGNDWTKVEFGTMIVKNPNGTFGALADTIYSNNLPEDLRIKYDTAEPVQGFWHSHPGTNRASGQQLIDRYPSIDDWDMLGRIKDGVGAVDNPSLWIMDYLGTTREFKWEEREYFKNLLNEGTKMEHGEGLEGRERAQSCG